MGKISSVDWNVFGHDWAVGMLSKHIVHQSVRHAYLFCGPPGIGKRTLAIRFAQAINCKQPVKPGVPCGQCRICLQIERMIQPDLSIIQSINEDGQPIVGGNIKVDQIRTLQHMLSLMPYEAHSRVALILRFHEATESAQNALLKTLEEAPRSVVLVITADTPESLLPTIVSRCEIIRLRACGINGLSRWLHEQHHIPNDKAYLLSYISSGRVGYALYLDKNPKELKQRKTHMDDLIRILSCSRIERMAYAQMLTPYGEIGREKLSRTMNYWLSFWRDITNVTCDNDENLVNVDMATEIKGLSKALTTIEAKSYLRELENGIERLNSNVNPRLMAEVLLLDMPYHPMAARS